MTKTEIFEKGNTMTTALGLENESVLLFWKAYEEDRLLACFLHLRCQGFC